MPREKLLLVDDEEGIRKVLGSYLADMGYEVKTVENGAEAWKIFQQDPGPIVLTDIKMPGIGGIDLLKLIKQNHPWTEVIMITGHGDLDLAIKSLQLEATDFITKPINDDILDIALRRARERISMRRQLRDYTENLETMVKEKSERLVEMERLAAVGQAVEGLATAIRDIVEDFGGGLSYFNEMPCLVSVHNQDLRIVSANQLFKERFGDRLGSRSWEIYAPDSIDEANCPVALTFKTGQGQRLKSQVRLPNGEDIPVIVYTAPIRNQDRGEVELVLEISADIMEIRRLQEELRTTRDHLTSLGLLIGSVSHGVKGVLTALDGGMYRLESGLTKEDRNQIKEGLEVVKAMVGRIRHMTLDILYYAKKRDLEWEQVKVLKLAQDVANVMESKLRNQKIDFSLDFDQALGEFHVDPGVVSSALINFLENAMDACLEDAGKNSHHIIFEAKQDAQNIIFSVQDNGIGMDEDTRKKLFTLFFSSKGRRGTGLGLYLSHQVISQHDGTIEVESTPGQGSRFTIHLHKFPRDLANQP
ncbi:MAG: response regulator [Deltaproteobacteria bacterium]|nr:response regulator [Deltaproteobacteria bacterium]